MTPAEIIQPSRDTRYANGTVSDKFTLGLAAIQAGTISGAGINISTFDVFDVPQGRVLSHVEARVTEGFTGGGPSDLTVVLRRKTSGKTNALSLMDLDDNSSAPYANGEGLLADAAYTLEAVVTATDAGIAELTAGAVKFRLHYLYL